MSINKISKSDMKSILSVGLDVAKSKIDVCFSLKDKNIMIQISNSQKGIWECITHLENLSCPKDIPFIIESTGDYNTLACLLFSESKFQIKEINPIMTKRYVKSTIRNTKTDTVDAKILAHIGILNNNELFPYDKTRGFIELSKKISLVSNLETQLQSLKATLNSFREVNKNIGIEVSSKSIKNIEMVIQELEENVKSLQAEIAEQSLWEKQNEQVKIIESIKGVSKYMSQVFYVCFAHKSFASKASMYAFVWYEPQLRESGKMVWRSRISKRWNPYVRKKLFQAAFGGVRHCKMFRDIYEKAKAKGKHYFVCMNQVIKKMLHILYALLKNNTYFEVT